MNELWLRSRGAARARRPAPEYYRWLRTEVARFHGLTVSTMMRGEAFGFYLLGIFLERADMTGAAPRREVPPAAARRVAGRLAARLLPVGGAAEVAVRLRGLPPQVPRGCGRSTSPSSSSSTPDFPRSLRFAVDRMQQALIGIGAAETPLRRARARGRAGAPAREERRRGPLRSAACTSSWPSSWRGHRRLHGRCATSTSRRISGRAACATDRARDAARLSRRRCASTSASCVWRRATTRRSAARPAGSRSSRAAELRRYLDCFGNSVHRFSLLAPHDQLVARVRERGRDLARESVRLRAARARTRARLARAARCATSRAAGLRAAPQRRRARARRASSPASRVPALPTPSAPLLDNVHGGACDWARRQLPLRARHDRRCTPRSPRFAEQRAGVLPGLRAPADRDGARLGLRRRAT